jgi:hypothetical protein
MIDFDKLNTISSSCMDGFAIRSFDSVRLLVVGSVAHCYGHHVEVEFVEVIYCSCAVWMDFPSFRMANRRERNHVSRIVDLDPNYKVFAIDAETCTPGSHTFFIVAEDATMRERTVKYTHWYPPPDGEPIRQSPAPDPGKAPDSP